MLHAQFGHRQDLTPFLTQESSPRRDSHETLKYGRTRSAARQRVERFLAAAQAIMGSSAISVGARGAVMDAFTAGDAVKDAFSAFSATKVPFSVPACGRNVTNRAPGEAQRP